MMLTTPSPRWLISGALFLLLFLLYTGLMATDKATWLMETVAVMIVVPLLWATHRGYPLSSLLYTLIFFHAVILMVGGMYTYARVPVGFQVQEWLALSRNPYDKLGHFFQGLVPALAAREILLRGGYVQGCRMLNFVVCCIALAMGQGADEFLGTQGDPWDTQSDMFCALLGAIFTVTFLGPWQRRQLGPLAQ